MSELGQRMLDGDREPDAGSVEQWIGARNYKRWTRLLAFIDEDYPGVFTPDWIFSGKKYGWWLSTILNLSS